MKLFILTIIAMVYVCSTGCSLPSSQTEEKLLGNQIMKKIQKNLHALQKETNSKLRTKIAEEIAFETRQISKHLKDVKDEDINSCI